MRFEIGKGGIAAISLGLILLSTSVFVFGLCVGWDIGSQSQRAAAQMATAYPLESPPAAAEPSPVAAAARPEPSASEVAPPPVPSESANLTSAPAAASERPTNREAHSSIASNAGTEGSSVPAAAAPLPANGAKPETASPPPQTATAERTAPARGHRKPFNIQIEAAMDSAGATQMTRRLQQLGYSSHVVPTDINGQTWYKVEIGPYGTQEEAAAAEAQLRARYNATYGAGGHPDQPAQSDSE